MICDEAFLERPSVSIPLIVRPGACGDEVVGWSNGALIVHVVAENARGAADAAVENLMAEVLGVELTRVRVVAGRGCRAKWLAIDGCDEADIELRLPGRHAASPPWGEAVRQPRDEAAGPPWDEAASPPWAEAASPPWDEATSPPWDGAASSPWDEAGLRQDCAAPAAPLMSAGGGAHDLEAEDAALVGD